MKLDCTSGNISEDKADAAVIFVSAYQKISDSRLKQIDRASSGAVTTLLDTEEFTGKMGEVAQLLHPDGFRVARIILVGLGDKRSLTPESYRKAAGTVSRFKGLEASGSALLSLGDTKDPICFQAAVEGYFLGSQRILEYKTGDSAVDKNRLRSIRFLLADKKALVRVSKAIERGQIMAEGQMMVRQLATKPSNRLTPKMFASEAQRLAKKHGFSCKILDKKEIEREKMGALLSVAQGSIEEPRFAILKHNGGRTGHPPVVLVGKGVTFDSGGISLKQALNMHEMKGDMTGAAIVLATVVTASRLALPINLVALMPMTENMPSGTATRPGDIINSRKGLTIEIINTDAEGRLILADALDFANKFKPQAVIDIATLTGACLFSLGYEGAPIFGNNRRVLDQIKVASETTSERVWEFPLWEEYGEAMKSPVADLVNSGGRDAGTCKAAAFLERFIGDWPWAHIDVAYVDIETKGRAYIPKGVTGIGLRLLVELLSKWKKPGR